MQKEEEQDDTSEEEDKTATTTKGQAVLAKAVNGRRGEDQANQTHRKITLSLLDGICCFSQRRRNIAQVNQRRKIRYKSRRGLAVQP